MAMLEGRGQGRSGHGEAGFGCRVEAWRGWNFDWILMQGRGREKEVHLISGDLRGSVYMDMMWPWRFDRSARILTQGQTGQVRGGWIREA
jgi:hypothetical protein